VKKRKLKSTKRICSEVLVNSPDNPWNPEEEKEGYAGWDLRKAVASILGGKGGRLTPPPIPGREYLFAPSKF